MKIAILTMFNGLSSTYSLVNVVKEQLRMLLDDNISVKMLVCQDCPDRERTGIFADERIEWVKINNRYNNKQIIWHDYASPNITVHDTFFQEADVVAEDLVKNLSDCDYCFMHDIHYQGWHLMHNVAIRKAQKQLPNTKFLAFTHSAPANPAPNAKWPGSARYSPMDNTDYIYPTECGLPALAKQYNVPIERCHSVNNSLDCISYMSPELQDIATKIDLITPEILIVYPGRLTTGKNFHKVTAFAGIIKQVSHKSVHVVFCDFGSMDVKPEVYKKMIINSGVTSGLSENDITFTSDIGYYTGVKRETVLDLFTLSNLFICPSISESFGLTVLEAISRGNFIVVNGAVPALDELSESLNLYKMRWNAVNFGFTTFEHYKPSEYDYYFEHAVKILNLMDSDPVLKAKTLARRRYNPRWIWENQLKPLLK